MPKSMLFKIPTPGLAGFLAGEYRPVEAGGHVPPGVTSFTAYTEHNGEEHRLMVLENYVLKDWPRFDPAWALVRILNDAGLQIHFSFVLLGRAEEVA